MSPDQTPEDAAGDVPDHVPLEWVDDDPSVPRDVVRGAVLVLPVARVRELAQVCALTGVHGILVPVPGAGSAFALHDPVTAEAAAQAVSRVLGRVDVLLVTRSGAEGGSSSAGQLHATRWRRGEQHDAPAPGVLLASLPDVLERLVLGLGDPAEVPGAVDTRTVPVATARGALGGWLRSRRRGTGNGDEGPTAP